MGTNKILLFVGVFLMLLSFSCKKEKELGNSTSGRTVMVYMAANNSLNGDAYANINQMEKAYQGIGGKLLVYARLKNLSPRIYEIAHDTGSDIKSRVVKEYGEHNSSDPQVMATVIADMQQLAPSSSYGLILWSHATSWHPKPDIALESFGEDAGVTMDIKDLKNALPNGLDFLLFDACSMASIEVLYELRDKAKYVVASPAEVISVGMPYDKMLANLFEASLRDGLVHAAQSFYNYYNGQSGLYRSATISVIDQSELIKVAESTNAFLKQHAASWNILKRDEVQRLDFASGSATAGFDMIDFYEQNFPQGDLTALDAALEKCVIYKAHTPLFNGKEVKAYCGLSMYIPHQQNAWVHPYYETLDWYGASNAVALFKWIN